MSYMDIPNLYKAKEILLFNSCYAMEKIHGSSAHISWNAEVTPSLHFFSGGAKLETFMACFDIPRLEEFFKSKLLNKVIIFGEAYGGKMQGMSKTYGKELRFVAFEVKIEDCWLSVDKAYAFVSEAGLDFVPFRMIPADIDSINAERDRPSEQAVKNGMGEGHLREGIVLRPLIECRMNNGERIIAKHKRDEFKETTTPREVDSEKLKVISDAKEIAAEWVTPMRLEHILQNFPEDVGMEQTGDVIRAMWDDICKEAVGEIVESPEAKKQCCTRTAQLFKKRVLEGKK